MDRCTHYQTQMLDYVYDLLDEDVVRALALHLEHCADCQAALREARGQQQLLAAAARLEFPSVCFRVPQEAAPVPLSVPAQDEPAPLLIPARPKLPLPLPSPPGGEGRVRGARSRRFAWRAWLSAAAVLLALSVPGWFSWDYLSARHDLDRSESADILARRDRDTLTERLAQLDHEESAKAQDLEKKVRQQERSVIVIGPRTLQSGTPNDYRIETRTGENKEVPARLTARVYDKASGELLYEETDKESDGSYRLTLPANLRVGPNARVMLEVEAKDADGARSRLREEFQLTPPLYLTHLATDKPIYQPGETVRFRSLTLERFSLAPVQEKLALHFSLSTPEALIEIPQAELRNSADVFAFKTGLPFRFGWSTFGTPLTLASPRVTTEGSPVAKQATGEPPVATREESQKRGTPGEALRGLAGGEWEIPTGCPPGEYTLTVSEEQNRFTPQRRKFLVHYFQKPRLLEELDFTRSSYGPGEEVVAISRATRADGSPFAHRPVTATVKVDGKTFDADGWRGGPLRLGTDENGKVHVRFKLPDEIDTGRASLEVAFHDGNRSESIFRPVPVVLKKLAVEFYPEGGSLVPDGPNRVYFHVHTPQGRPAELKGRLFDDTGDEVARVETFHDASAPGTGQGAGMFTLTPHRGHVYRLKVDSPAGVEVADTLEAKELGKVALSVPSPVTTAHEPIEVRVRSAGADRKLLVAAYCRGRLFDHKRVEAKAEQEETVRLKPADGVGGVYRVTVFEEVEAGGTRVHLEPRAERLVFRRHRDRLNLDVTADKPFYVPGQHATLTLTSRGEDQELISSVGMVSVVDRAALALAGEQTARSMPTHFYLTSEVQGAEDLENADFLLTANRSAERVLDLLLGTQGWRRFVERAPGESRQGRDEPVLALAPVEVPRVDRDKDPLAEQAGLGKKVELGRQELHERFRSEREQLLARQAEREEMQRKARTAPDFLALRARVASYEGLVTAVRALFPLVGLFLVIAAAVLLGRGLGRPPGRAAPHFSAAAVCAGLLIILGTVAFSSQPAREGEVEGPVALAPQQKAEKAEPRKKEGEKQAPSAPEVKEERVAEGVEREASDGALRTTQDSFQKKDENEAKKNVDELPRPSQDVPPPTVPPPPGGVQPPVPEMVPPPSPRKPAHASLRRPDDKKPSSTESVPPQGGFGGSGIGGGFSGQTVPQAMSRQNSAAGAQGQADKPASAGQGGVRTYAGEAEKDAGEELKRIDSLVGKEGRSGRPLLELGKGNGPMGQPLGDGAARFAREYRHLRQEEETAPSPDFTDTVCWQPALVLPGGRVELGFNLNDAVTTYQVTMFGHTLDGRLAAATRTLEVRKPLSVQPLAPDELTAGDRADVRVNVVNRTGKAQDVDVDFFHDPGKKTSPTPKEPAADDMAKTTSRLKLQAGETSGILYPFTPDTHRGDATLRVQGRWQNLPVEVVRRNIRVVPEGFPIAQSRSDLLEGRAEHTVVLPREWVKGTLDFRVEVFPSALADVQKGLDALLRQPAGNFEQVVTASHSNVLLLDQLKEAKELRPELEKESRELLAGSYRAMTSFECIDPARQGKGGFEWFGGTTAPHEELTAYGLMQFRNLARFQEVDRALLERTRTFLLSRRDRGTYASSVPSRDRGAGGFVRDAKGLDSPDGPPAHVGDAYIVWALTESGGDNVTRELDALAVRAKTSKDPYFLALVANSLRSRHRMAEAVLLLQKIVAVQKEDGHLDAEQTSVTGSRGRDLQIETTALAVLGWQRADAVRFRAPVERAVRWLDRQRDGFGAFGSTQATVLALKALASHSRGVSRVTEDGELLLSVEGQRVARLAFKAGATGPLVLTLPEPEKVLKPGANRVRIDITGKNRLPATLSWAYRSLEPVHDEACPVRLSTSLDRTQAVEGQRVRLTVRLENTAASGQSVAVAVVGLPAGLSLPDKRLSKDTGRAQVGSLEVRGRELVLSWRGLAPRQKVEVPVDLLCRVPGDYRGPASQAYLQYNADHKAWAAPLHVRISPKK
ncbi:MAG: hypothetical protein HYS12_02895 [Planctomycetes bacterium]|nr:hypothetical protein [Planctomycetota bacterium]